MLVWPYYVPAIVVNIYEHFSKAHASEWVSAAELMLIRLAAGPEREQEPWRERS